jgi:hypothetical protein
MVTSAAMVVALSMEAVVEDHPEEIKLSFACETCKELHMAQEQKRWGFHMGHKGLRGWWPHKNTKHVQEKLVETLESRSMHWTVIVLTLLDLCVVITEIVLTSFYCGSNVPEAGAHGYLRQHTALGRRLPPPRPRRPPVHQPRAGRPGRSAPR